MPQVDSTIQLVAVLNSIAEILPRIGDAVDRVRRDPV